MRRTLLLPLAALAWACASAPALPPKSDPEQVRVFDARFNQVPDPGYRTIGPVKVERPLGTADADLIAALRAEAARLGADAVIVQRIRRTTEGEVTPDLTREERMIAEGVAIYWPANRTSS